MMALVMVLSWQAQAEVPSMPSDVQIRESMRASPRMPADQVIKEKVSEQDIQRKAREGFEKITPEMLHNHAGKDIVNIQAEKPKVDFDGIAARFREFKPGDAADESGPRVLVFVSLSMPPASLDRALSDAARAKTVLVLRGLVNNSFKDTARTIKELIGDRSVGWYVDPTLYERYGVKTVPAVAVVLREEKTCGRGQVCKANDKDYVIVRGDVPVAYALEYIAKHNPGTKKAVAPYLSRLGGRP
jgi:conjugal transfer pilus assembly protein TrbC